MDSILFGLWHMIFDGKPAQSILPDDVKQLVSEGIVEDQYLDYKRSTYEPNDHGKAELLKDVTAFLNADGGYLIIGIEDDGSGRPTCFNSVDDPENVRRSILDRCLHSIDPRPAHLTVGLLSVDENNIVVVHAPESDQKPHCARPDAEHHYFWRRYEDGNKLMTTAEIRQCLEGDRVERQLAEMRRELSAMRSETMVAQEISLDVGEEDLLQLNTTPAFLKHVERTLLPTIGDRPYYRLFACPEPLAGVILEGHMNALRSLAERPPSARPHGWDLGGSKTVRVTGNGAVARDISFHRLRLFRNGYMEFLTPADDESFHWVQSGDPKPINPNAIIEPTLCFALLARDVCRLGGYNGQLRFGLTLYNASELVLVPNAPDSVWYMIESACIGERSCGRFTEGKHLCIQNVSASNVDLPGVVPWRLVSEVYYRFGYSDDQVPFFDDQHQCTIGVQKE